MKIGPRYGSGKTQNTSKGGVMAKSKKRVSTIESAVGAIAEKQLSTDASAMEAGRAASNIEEQTADAAGADESKTAFQPIRETFTSSKAGVHAGEDRRFRKPQAFVAFDDDRRATDEEKAILKEKGFRYRPNDKGYSTLATTETRQARDELANSFAGKRLREKSEDGSRDR